MSSLKQRSIIEVSEVTMKSSVQGKAKKIIIIISLLIVAILAAILLFAHYNKPAPENNVKPTDDKDSTIIDDIEPKPDDELQPDDPPSNDEPKDTQPEPKSVCDGNTAAISTYTLSSPAYVYNTALDAKNKTNPALSYQPGGYYIFKCFDGIANITRTPEVPGGWIDPANPYAPPASPDEASDDTPALNVMSIDNTIVNWSHEYPTAFVTEYNGYWNLSPSNLYLTFDCGYDYNNLASTIMNTLRAKNVKAMFFVTGDFMNDRPDLIRRMVSEGHIVGNHSYAHLNQPQNLTSSTDIVVADIRAWETKYRNIMGVNPPKAYFRPPAGAISRRS
ncbi:hypothetical protein EOL96_05985, partial [Candidatus Saccharibacteria bacterium]|nr:hypothetical protein [Candidatus Saccharibacteria bacterium]